MQLVLRGIHIGVETTYNCCQLYLIFTPGHASWILPSLHSANMAYIAETRFTCPVLCCIPAFLSHLLVWLDADFLLFVQSSSAATPTATGSPLIPTGISSSCTTFLTNLNDNSTITSCLKPIISATSQFGPSGSSSTNPTTADVTSALSQLCSSTTTCSDSTIRSQLTQFYSACSAELSGTSSNTDIIRLYDVLYAIVPFKAAACTKDDSGNYCVTQISTGSSNSTTGSKSVSSTTDTFELLKNNLVEQSGSTLTRRATVVQNVTAALIPNTTTFRTTGLPFLLLTPSTDSSKLCTACTRSVLLAYIDFEQDIPYAPGLSNSPILGGQTALYNGVTSVCGSSFMSGAVQAAGGLSNGLISAASNVRVDQVASFGTLLAAVAAGVVALL